ncbi:hypothetical protein FEM03_17160 [Phragmitibacter flavus]|uniref:Class I SAM-dependent methyltransferase n=1 Tax=Phragmitibacter flavus TaxID=2576071 RepID=A0A5R8KBJ1_9BACT|nr:hypothetical protein [Phragmitibacter flavus]TLD69684.1 hypothetical protein FEM03_17160 [Phragmitibacter flavus]
MSLNESRPPPKYSPRSWKHREVRPEALDSIKHDDPLAVSARNELNIVNFLMGNHRWIVRQLHRHLRPGWRVLELGAGSGLLGNKIIKKLGLNPRCLIGNDVIPRPKTWPEEALWQTGSVLDGSLPEAEIIVANLLLHQFDDQELATFTDSLPPTCRLILAVDPLRSRMALWEGKIMVAITRMNPLTKVDMETSVHNGFRNNELPDALPLHGWTSQVSTTWRGGYRVKIHRNESS